MTRPVVLIHGYSAQGKDFDTLCTALRGEGVNAVDLNIANYISLNNEITIKDIAEGLDRAFRTHPTLGNEDQAFDVIVHSTGMLVIRSWLTNYGAAVTENNRLKRLKHLIGLAPATWGSPQAHKGRTWLGALVKGDKQMGPDFLNAGDEVLDGLELGSRFTWDLAHEDLLGPEPYYDKGADTPYVCVFIGNTPYSGVSSVANDPGTDGTVRWAGCGLNTRKITIDLTRTPFGPDGKAIDRVSISGWADNRLDIPMIPVDDRNHATLIANPDKEMVDLVRKFLTVGDEGGPTFDTWLGEARQYGSRALPRMLINPGKGAAGIEGQAKDFFGHLFHAAEEEMEGWQQFVVRARDERGDPIPDYLIEVLVQNNGAWEAFPDMYTDVHPYTTDNSFRCFHVRLPKGASGGALKLCARINASTGTELMVYQGYGLGDDVQQLKENTEPIEIPLDLGDGKGTLFHPFTTTLVEIVLNREPFPLNAASRILTWWKPEAGVPGKS